MEKRTKIIIAVALIILIVVVVAIALSLLLSRPTTLKLEVWPRPDKNADSPLINYQAYNPSSHLEWKTRIDDFLKPYRHTATEQQLEAEKNGVQYVSCTYDKNVFAENQVCDVDLNSYFPCTQESNFQTTTPCLYLRLNKLRNWKPIPYNNTLGLPENMPKDLRQQIEYTRNAPESNNVWVSCQGEDPADQEYIGPIEYIPRRGFPVYYFPYTNQKGYLSPLVAVRFQKPQTGVLIKIVCKSWARNIKNDQDEQQGIIRFSLQID